MRLRTALAVPLGALLVTIGAHITVRRVARIEPPRIEMPRVSLATRAEVRRANRSSVRSVGHILEVRLAGSPEEIGATHARLLWSEMRETEGVVWNLLEQKVPNAVARVLLLDLGQFAYRNVASGFSPERARELAASAAGFAPDPFLDRFETFQRFVYLAALYDISLAYEHSPLLGCTTFAFGGSHVEGSPILARAFDFDVDDVFDERKAVFLVSEDGKIPFASVAWPGFVGVVSGMNREGLAVVVHGARAGPVHAEGEPVAHELRRLLAESRSTAEAIQAIGKSDPLVSHIVVMSDASGHAVRVERVPGAPPFVQPLADRDAVTNHLNGPYKEDPKNVRVRETTSTLARKERADELVQGVEHATAADAVRLLRDREGAGGVKLPLGDRRAIDALISTHAVVMETATRRLWVSEAPHSLGRFIAFDLAALLDPGLAAETDPPHAELPPDDLLTSGAYAKMTR